MSQPIFKELLSGCVLGFQYTAMNRKESVPSSSFLALRWCYIFSPLVLYHCLFSVSSPSHSVSLPDVITSPFKNIWEASRDLG